MFTHMQFIEARESGVLDGVEDNTLREMVEGELNEDQLAEFRRLVNSPAMADSRYTNWVDFVRKNADRVYPDGGIWQLLNRLRDELSPRVSSDQKYLIRRIFEDFGKAGVMCATTLREAVAGAMLDRENGKDRMSDVIDAMELDFVLATGKERRPKKGALKTATSAPTGEVETEDAAILAAAQAQGTQPQASGVSAENRF